MSARPAQRGVTLVEVLVAMALLSIVLIPAMHALQTGMTGANVHRDLAADQFRLTSRMEDLLAQPFATLEAAAISAGSPSVPSSYSDVAGPAGRLIVYLSLYDGDNADADDDPFTGTDPGLIWIQVEAENTIHNLQTVKAQGY